MTLNYYYKIYSLFFIYIFFFFFFFFFGFYLYLFKIIYFMEWVIIEMNSMKFSFVIYIDFMSMMYLSTVILITGIVMLYSIEYMENDLYIERFKLLVFIFMISMCFMILSPSMIGIILGWDGLGLISYCLVIYYQNKNSYNSGMLTVCCNRLGDVALILIICMLSFFGSWNIFFYQDFKLISLFMLIMMLTKSAQFPFSFWLPAAMTAPTPVSSLVHSSTLVTAGVYLLIRYNKMFMDLNFMNILMLLIFSFTMFMSGLMANFEMNFKKVIALSTLSQLSFMMSILLLGNVDLGFFHLICHALFKSTMFLSVGSFIHMNLGIQDLRFFSGNFYINPLKSFMFILSILNLCGFPFITGFFSKDLIMEMFYNFNLIILIMMILYISIVLTVSYSIRLLNWVLIYYINYFSYLYVNESSSKYMNYSFILMGGFSIFYGKYFYNMFIYENFKMTLNDKYVLLLMYFLSLMFYFEFKSLIFLKKSVFVKMSNFILSMFYSEYLLKIFYVWFINKMFNFEIMFDKSVDKVFMMNLKFLMNFMIKNNVLMKIYKENVGVVNMLFYYFIIFMFFLFM